jgi:hypothetical protein
MCERREQFAVQFAVQFAMQFAVQFVCGVCRGGEVCVCGGKKKKTKLEKLGKLGAMW